MRGLGLTGALADLPASVVAAFALLTQLGDAWFVFGLLALVYWLADGRLASDPRRAGATLVALGIAALGATVLLKSLFALPRPPGATTEPVPAWLPAALGSFFEAAATGDGFGFPSGHAIGSTVAYGGLALTLDRLWSRERRLAVAGLVVLAVSASRLVIGVHYLVDVAAGVLVGAAVLLGTLRLAGARGLVGARGFVPPDPFRAFAVAGGLAVAAAVVASAGGHAGEVFEASIGVGGALGGAAGWWVADDRRPVSVPVAAVGLLATGGLWGGVYAIQPPIPLAVLGSVLAVGGVVVLPGLAGRVDAIEK